MRTVVLAYYVAPLVPPLDLPLFQAKRLDCARKYNFTRYFELDKAHILKSHRNCIGCNILRDFRSVAFKQTTAL